MIEKYRVKKGPWATKENDGHGFFFIPFKRDETPLKVLCAPKGGEWQHVSVSLPNRCPTWNEMNYIKDLFWNDDETVVQIHPPKSEHVNNHKFCLHLWKHRDGHKLPPSILIGFKNENN